MFTLKDLLEKFKSIQDPKKIRQTMCDILNEELNLKGGVLYITPDKIQIKHHILWAKIHPALRQKLMIAKPVCLEKINSALPEEKIIDIR